ncbi:MAG TPA: DUF885 domain-containing protein [Xanthomonadales bacterium]|nr:DUF885 domain-containing protein [Xanthomonadales bacterium]
MQSPGARFLVGFLITTSLLASTTTFSAQQIEQTEPEWLERSNAIAYRVLEMSAGFAPEFAAQQGIEGLDEDIFDLAPNRYERQQAVEQEKLEYLEEMLAAEEDPRVILDIEIMIKAVRDNIESNRINHERVSQYGNFAGVVFFGLSGLLDKQIPAERQQAALVRLRKYTGQADGYLPFTEGVKSLLTERDDVDGLIQPYAGEVEQHLERAPMMIDGIPGLFEAAGLEGWEEDYELLTEQFAEYNEWVRETILPRARANAALPRELYELGLKNWGVDAAPEELIRTGQIAFTNIRNEMMAIAPLIAAERGWEISDYRDVIRRLNREQAQGGKLVEAYREVMEELDIIIEREGLATLPDEAAQMRMATPAETAQQPAAHLKTPRLVGNTGEFPEFIVPYIPQNEDGSWPQNDYAVLAGMWTLSAHEARPGHEMQFTTMLQGGVSIARATFAFNSANVEGWALYAEAISKPYMPLEGQLYSLQARLLRAARIWLDPMLNLGLITPDEAKRVLMEDVMEGESNAQNEIDRYTFQIPGQATAYYYGYEHLQALRAQTELRLKDQFNQKDYHDFILAQGLLPPDLLEDAIERNFITPQLSSQSR